MCKVYTPSVLVGTHTRDDEIRSKKVVNLFFCVCVILLVVLLGFLRGRSLFATLFPHKARIISNARITLSVFIPYLDVIFKLRFQFFSRTFAFL